MNNLIEWAKAGLISKKESYDELDKISFRQSLPEALRDGICEDGFSAKKIFEGKNVH